MNSISQCVQLSTSVVFQEVEIDGIGKLHPAESQLAKLGLISLALSLSLSLSLSLAGSRGERRVHVR